MKGTNFEGFSWHLMVEFTMHLPIEEDDGPKDGGGGGG